ncbi:MAG TPA: hypothetical protein VKP02_01340 [Gemmatimonadaceae bacterium]|nr:hypothetical protein [Gemmatimonadaceae bacterium]
MKQALAVVAGYVLWSMLWLGLNQVLLILGVLTPSTTEPLTSATPLLLLLIGSVLLSLVSGYVAARIAGSAWALCVIVLGVMLLLTGIFVEIQVWYRIPLWYHVSFLVLLIPMTFLGARMRARSVSLA